MRRPEVASVIGFDLGETLFTYADTPLSWTRLYPFALARVATACDTRPDAAGYAQAEAVLARYNTRLQPRTTEVRAEQIFTEILRAWGVSDVERMMPAALAGFFNFFQQRLVAYPESVAVLTALREAELRVGALTDVPYGMPRACVEHDLRATGLAPLLDVLLTSVEIGERKPAPTGFHALSAILGERTTAWWYVGNEEKDIIGARAAGGTAVLIDREHRGPRWGQTHPIHDLREILPLLGL